MEQSIENENLKMKTKNEDCEIYSSESHSLYALSIHWEISNMSSHDRNRTIVTNTRYLSTYLTRFHLQSKNFEKEICDEKRPSSLGLV
jgi:hypothetical protein